MDPAPLCRGQAGGASLLLNTTLPTASLKAGKDTSVSLPLYQLPRKPLGPSRHLSRWPDVDLSATWNFHRSFPTTWRRLAPHTLKLEQGQVLVPVASDLTHIREVIMGIYSFGNTERQQHIFFLNKFNPEMFIYHSRSTSEDQVGTTLPFYCCS